MIELAKEFNVSARTIQRDFNERLVGLYPIYQENRLWKMDKGAMRAMHYDVETTLVATILEKFTEGIGGVFAQKAQHFLSRAKNSIDNPIYTKLHMEEIGDKLHEITQLERSIAQKQHITCDYPHEENTKHIELKPLKIANFEGVWYLIALDARNDMLKKYHLKSLTHITPQKESFTTTRELDKLLNEAVNVWFDDKTPPFEVILHADAYAAKSFLRKPLSSTQEILQTLPDASIKMRITITHPMEILSIIKYWIPYVVVQEPKWLAQRLIEESTRFIERQNKLLE